MLQNMSDISLFHIFAFWIFPMDPSLKNALLCDVCLEFLFLTSASELEMICCMLEKCNVNHGLVPLVSAEYDIGIQFNKLSQNRSRS